MDEVRIPERHLLVEQEVSEIFRLYRFRVTGEGELVSRERFSRGKLLAPGDSTTVFVGEDAPGGRAWNHQFTIRNQDGKPVVNPPLVETLRGKVTAQIPYIE